jgi:hypothetical protein
VYDTVTGKNGKQNPAVFRLTLAGIRPDADAFGVTVPAWSPRS